MVIIENMLLSTQLVLLNVKVNNSLSYIKLEQKEMENSEQLRKKENLFK